MHRPVASGLPRPQRKDWSFRRMEKCSRKGHWCTGELKGSDMPLLQNARLEITAGRSLSVVE
jgi:hypothetical protein